MDLSRLNEIIRELQQVEIPDEEAQRNIDGAIAYLACASERVRKIAIPGGCKCRKMKISGVGEVVNSTGCPIHGTTASA